VPSVPDPIDVAARALRHRDRSRAQIDARLEGAGVGDGARAEALAALERAGWVDDTRFAGLRAATLADRGFGDAVIRHDLEESGVGAEDVEHALAGLPPEGERITAIVARRGATVATAAHLARKGFDEDAIASAVGADVAEPPAASV